MLLKIVDIMEDWFVHTELQNKENATKTQNAVVIIN